MVQDFSWRLGKTSSFLYRLYDYIRARLNIRIVHFLLSSIGARREKMVLEAGSGPAFGADYFSRAPGVKRSIAFDYDIEALREASKRGSNLSLVAGDVNQMPFKSEIFDLVWNSSTLEHLENPMNALTEMKRVTRHDGFVFVGVPFRGGPLFFQPWICNTRIGNWIGPVFTEKRITSLFRDAGLKPVGISRYFFRFFIGVIATKT